MEQGDQHNELTDKTHELFEEEKRVMKMIMEFNEIYMNNEGKLKKSEVSSKFCDILAELIKVGKPIASDESDLKEKKLEICLPSAGIVEIYVDSEEGIDSDAFNISIDVSPPTR